MQDDRKSKPITDYGATITLRPRKSWLRTTPLTGSQLLVERGPDPSVLIVAFTGFAGGLSMPTFDFLRSTELLNYNRILLCDNSRTCYLNGIPPVANDVGALQALLRQHIDQLAPKYTMFIGSSGGSHAAILFGYLLGADFVHAFSPHTNIDPAHWRASEVPEDVEAYSETIVKMEHVPPAARAYFDLRQVLRRSNGKTAYNLHVCAQSVRDLARAMRLDGLPGVTIHRHPCAHHRVGVWLAGQRRLLPLLKLENQPGFAVAAGGGTTAI
jgi:hypothetical protein